MDWVALLPLLLIPILQFHVIVFSYDVACQWRINLRHRIKEMPEAFHVFKELPFHFAIPKGHMPGHNLDCQPDHSLNLMYGVGRTDGEGIERGWSSFNGLASSTKEMGPRARHDTIDDHVGHHNWRKNVLLGPLLAKRLKVARKVLQRQEVLHQEFCESIGPTQVVAWTAEVEAWEADREHVPNPYHVKADHKCVSSLHCTIG